MANKKRYFIFQSDWFLLFMFLQLLIIYLLKSFLIRVWDIPAILPFYKVKNGKMIGCVITQPVLATFDNNLTLGRPEIVLTY